jgi:hypothetical protein
MSQQPRRSLIIIGGTALLLTAVGVSLAIRTGHPVTIRSFESFEAASASRDGDLRTAKITNNSGDGGCWQQSFDNQTGRMTRSPKPCENTVYDASGTPVPVGTIHRLDAISKSFPGH